MTERTQVPSPDVVRTIEEGVAHHRAGRMVEAEATYRRALDLAPGEPDALNLLSAVALHAGRNDEAVDLLRKATASKPADPMLQNNLGLAFKAQGRFDEAAGALRRALELDSSYASAYDNLGNVLKAQDDLDGAVAAFESAIKYKPDIATTHSNLAIALKRQGDLSGALAACERAIKLNRKVPAVHNTMGNVLQEQGKMAEAVAAYRRVIKLDPGHAKAHANLGNLLRQTGRHEAAIEQFRSAVDCAPENETYRSNLRDAYASMIPAWHFPMLGDRARNDAYQRAIEKAVEGDSIVLDIGTGSGLLSMMAARAGAKHVIACEMVKPLAEVAERIVASNGYADRITVVAKQSTQLEVGRELPAPASLLISEILDYRLIGEGVLPTLRHANANLVAPDAKVIPAAATVWGVVIEAPRLRSIYPLGEINGFDLSEFEQFRNPLTHQTFDMEHEDHQVLTPPFEVMRVDFRRPPVAQAPKPMSLETTASGTGHAVAFWFDLHLDDEITLSNRPGDPLCHWRQGLQFLERDLPLTSGQRFELAVGHTDASFIFRLPSAP